MLDTAKIKDVLLHCAREAYSRGPAFAQEPFVLDAATHRLCDDGLTIDDQQLVLRCWLALFREKTLVWGYDFENPAWPFFHVALEQAKDNVVDNALEARLMRDKIARSFGATSHQIGISSGGVFGAITAAENFRRRRAARGLQFDDDSDLGEHTYEKKQ